AGAESSEPTAFHHLLELLEIDHPVAVDVHLHDHPPAILDGAALLQPQRGQHGPELVDGDESVAVLVEDVEGLPHVFFLVPLVHDRLVELSELVHVDESVAVDVDLLDHLREVDLRDEDPQVLERVAQLLLGDLPVPVLVEHLEHSPQLIRVHDCFFGFDRRRTRRCGNSRLELGDLQRDGGRRRKGDN
ncbi:hypothetical protein LINGRAHAP2_LOCUS19506, partial [Linum grandiflorum]